MRREAKHVRHLLVEISVHELSDPCETIHILVLHATNVRNKGLHTSSHAQRSTHSIFKLPKEVLQPVVGVVLEVRKLGSMVQHPAFL